MKVSGVRTTGGAAASGKAKKSGADFTLDAASPNAGASGLDTVARTDVLGALIALQSEGRDQTAEAKTFAAAQHLLEQLETLQQSVLDGAPDEDELAALAGAAQARAHAGATPALQNLYDEIALRARVELAKRQLSTGNGPE
ncbi:MAG: flagellar assembly protein FliX [Pseudomonadota bacterium]